MHKRLLLVSSLALSASLLLGSGSHPVGAQEKNSTELMPKSGWSVARIDGNANTADSYCALSRQYDEGLVLTLGRNEAEEYSLALDFQKTKLNPDRAYSLTLQPGPGQIRAYEMMPASQQAIVVRLGYDQSFFDALEKSGFLKIEVDNNLYNFNVPDFSAGQSDLNGCLKGLKGGSPTKVAKDFSAEKIAEAPPMKEMAKKQDVAPPAPVPAKIVEAAKVVPPKPVVEPAVKEVKKEAPKDAPKIATAIVAEEPVKVAPSKVAEATSAFKSKPVPSAEKIDSKKIEAVKAEPKKIEMKRAEAEISAPPPALLKKAPPPPSFDAEIKEIQGLKTPEVKAPSAKTPSKPIQISRVESKQIDLKPAPAPTQIVKEQKAEAEILANLQEQAAAVPQPKTSAITSTEREVSKRPVIMSNNDSLLSRAGLKQPSVSSANINTPRAPIDAPPAAVPAPIVPAPSANQPSVSKLSDAKMAAPKTEAHFSSQTAAQKKQRDALEQLQAENARLNEALKTQNAPTENSAEMRTLKDKLEQLEFELVAAQNNKADSVDDQLKTDFEKLRSENEQLRLAVRAQATAQKQAETTAASKVAAKVDLVPEPNAEPQDVADKVDPEVIKQLDNLKTENTRLSAALQGQEQKMATFDAKSPEADKELAAMREQMISLQQENRKLYEDARQARGQIDSTTVAVGNQALTKIREYEKKLEAAQNDNLALAKEIEVLRRSQEDVRLDSVSGNWDLEKSTERYNEAEREIQRLGLLLEQQRMAHRQEKQELEGMLFDPAVTDEEQRRRLSELETQLAAAEQELKASGRGIPARPVTSSARSSITPADERVSLDVSVRAPEVERARDNLEVQRLNNQIARQNNQLQAYNRQAQPQAVEAVPLPTRQAVQQASVTPRAPSAPSVSSVSAATTKFDQNEIQQLLSRSGISVTSNITKKAAGTYRWNAGKLVGEAEIVPMKQAGSIDKFAQNYISKAKQSCGGDFASLPAAASGSSKAYEIACIGPSRSTSSSLVVTQKGNELVAIAHETSADDMDAAMDARDRIAANL